METRGDVTETKKDDDVTMHFNELDKVQCCREIAMYSYEKNPVSVKNRVNALKNLQLDAFKLEADFYKELNALEMKYEPCYLDLNKKRKEIYLGNYEPTKEEYKLKFTSDRDQMEVISEEMNNKLNVEEDKDVKPKQEINLAEGDQDVKGIPDFWYTIFKNVPILSERIEEYDWPIVKSIVDVSSVMINDIGPGFRLEFTFAPNDFFRNTVLTRSFYVNFELPPDSPMTYDGPEIVMSKGCKIDWKPGKNVTVKNIKQMKKSRNKGEKRSITKTCKTNSFFNFFEDIESKNENSLENTEMIQQIDSDFEIGQYLRERIIPRAVLFYTGEGIDEEDDELDEECSESSECSESESSSSSHQTGERQSRLTQMNK